MKQEIKAPLSLSFKKEIDTHAYPIFPIMSSAANP
jgi:hypothetical protein